MHIPEGIDDAAVRAALLADFDIEIGAGLGALAGKAWRIGLMGHSSRERNVYALLTALAAVLGQQGHGCDAGAAVAAARASYGA